ncbi:MAG TPA: alpha-hydroxy acid oxidase [Ktedonobacteraceae bacterium]|nr:alpha-hydroxy acid oxidase [Ktedonobacteraceae bacterium]
MEPINLFDYEKLAQERLDPALWDYFQAGSEDEITLRANRTAFERIRLRPRVLVDVSSIDMRTTVLGMQLGMPVMIAPMRCHCPAHPDGECASAQAAEEAGSLLIVGSFASQTIEEIAEATQGPLWFQLYTYRNLEVSEKVVRRAEAAGYRAIVLTVDVVRRGHREKDIRNQFNLLNYSSLVNYSAEDVAATPTRLQHLVDTWETVDWLRSITKLPIVLKGLLTAEDALLAVEHGVEGIVVSNHGGRQLDGAITGIEALPEIVEAVDGRSEIYLDGGIRRGTDILKALALGARAVLVGRPILWGLTVNGREGVRHVLEMLHSELETAMILSGRPTLASIDRSLVKLPLDWTSI